MVSIYYAWALAAIICPIYILLGSSFLAGFRPHHHDDDADAFSVIGPLFLWSPVAGAVWFFIFLLLSGAPVSDLDKYYVSKMSVFIQAFGVPLLVVAAGALYLAVRAALRSFYPKLEWILLAVLIVFGAKFNRLFTSIERFGAYSRGWCDDIKQVRESRRQRALTQNANSEEV